MGTISADETGIDTELPPYGEAEPRRRDVDRLFRSADFPMPDGLRAEVHGVAERLFGAPDGAPFKPGDRLGVYRVVRLLGAGGQAWVYEGVHEQLSRRVALKVPRPEVAERLIREARLAAPLEHPHIVRVEDIAADREVPFLVMECCTGGSLDVLMERYPAGLPLGDVRAVSRAVLEALEFAHRRGVVHRDVKPANILFDGRGNPKLADLGIGMIPRADPDLEHSVGVTAGTRDGPAGTPLFVAPEQEDPSRLRGGTLDGRADLFSFGKTLFVMLTGASPRTIRPPSRLRAGLDPAWDDFLFKLVEESRDRRFASASQALEALARLPEARTVALAPALPAPAPAPAPVAAPPAPRTGSRVFLLAGLASAGFAAFLEVQHTTFRLGPAWLDLAPLKAGALLGAAFLLWFKRLDRLAVEATSVVSAVVLSLLVAGWPPLLYAARELHHLSQGALDAWAPILAGTAALLGLGCAVTLFPRAPAPKKLPEVRVRPRNAPARRGVLGVIGRILGVIAGLATAIGAVLLAALGFVIVFLMATVKGCAEVMGVDANVQASTDPIPVGVGLAVLAAVGSTFAVVMLVSLLRRPRAAADDE